MTEKVIWIINQTAGTLDSGWGERHYFLAKKWTKKGYKVFVFSGTYNHLFTNLPKVGNRKLTIEEIEESITFCWVRNPVYKDGGYTKFWSNIVFTLRLFFLNLKTIPKPEVIIVSSMPIFPIAVGNYFKRKYLSKKLITEVRDLWPLTPIHLKGYSKRNPLVMILSWFEKYAYKKSDKIVSLLPNAQKHINKITKQPEKFHYIPNGIDSDLIENKNISEEIQRQIPKGKFIVGYAGTLGFANAMEFFIQASKLLEDHPSIHFLLVGDGVLKSNLQALVKENQKNITFLPKIPKSQVQDILSYMDVCYLSRYKSPLYEYGVSYNKYFDYMLAQKPILESSDYINDQVENSGCGIIVAPENPATIVDGIRQLYDMPKKQREELGKKGYEYVKKYHNFEYLSVLYLKLFS